MKIEILVLVDFEDGNRITITETVKGDNWSTALRTKFVDILHKIHTAKAGIIRQRILDG